MVVKKVSKNSILRPISTLTLLALLTTVGIGCRTTKPDIIIKRVKKALEVHVVPALYDQNTGKPIKWKEVELNNRNHFCLRIAGGTTTQMWDFSRNVRNVIVLLETDYLVHRKVKSFCGFVLLPEYSDGSILGMELCELETFGTKEVKENDQQQIQ